MNEIRLLTICSTRQRANRCREMLASFFATRSEGTEIFLYVDELDPQVEEYRKLFSEYPVKYQIGPHKYMCHVLNYASCELYPGLDYYSETNDDHIFRTKEWDKKLMNALVTKGKGVGIAYGKTVNYPTAIMLSGNYVRALGYFMPPQFQHHSCDVYIMDLGNATGTLIHVPEVFIEHMHRNFGLGPNDSNYEWVYSAPQSTHGVLAYEQWVKERRQQDIATITKLKNDARN